MQGSLLKDKSSDDSDEPICPIPPGTAKDDADSYYGGAAGHYTVETVAWIPVWLNDKCFIGTIFQPSWRLPPWSGCDLNHQFATG